MSEITKEHEKLINNFSHNYFGSKLKYPDLKEIQNFVLKKSGKKLPIYIIKKYRNKLPLISQFHPLNDTRRKNDKFSMLRITSLGLFRGCNKFNSWKDLSLCQSLNSRLFV